MVGADLPAVGAGGTEEAVGGLCATTNAVGLVTQFNTVTDTDTGLVDEGADSLTSIDALHFANVTLDVTDLVQLFSGGVLTGTFDTLAAALTAAVDGDTIRIGEGTIAGDATISKAVTILGADAGADATGREPSDGSHASNLVGHFSTYLHLEWTGQRVTDPSNASFMGVYSTLTQHGWNDTLMQAVGAHEHQLPQLMGADGGCSDHGLEERSAVALIDDARLIALWCACSSE